MDKPGKIISHRFLWSRLLICLLLLAYTVVHMVVPANSEANTIVETQASKSMDFPDKIKVHHFQPRVLRNHDQPSGISTPDDGDRYNGISDSAWLIADTSNDSRRCVWVNAPHPPKLPLWLMHRTQLI